MNGGLKLFRVAGIDIQLHMSWWFVFVFLSWSLATNYFPVQFIGYSSVMYWIMGVLAALLLFVSVLLHELSHSFVAQLKKIEVKSITLFFFGGVAGIEKEDMKPQDEFQMAIAGPLFSLLLGGVCYVLFLYVVSGFWLGIFSYLYQLNITLAVFNMVPAFPLDGGRAFRALLYGYYKDLRKATKIAASFGKGFGIFLIFVGVFSLFSKVGGGVWFIFLGGFLYFIAKLSYEQVAVRQVLMDVSVRDIMVPKLVTVDAQMKFIDFFKKYGYAAEDVFFVRDANFYGVLQMRMVQAMPVAMQEMVRLKQIALSLDKVQGVRLTDMVYTAWVGLQKQQVEVLPVYALDGKKIAGWVTQRAVMHCLSMQNKFGTISGMGSEVDKEINNIKISKKKK